MVQSGSAVIWFETYSYVPTNLVTLAVLFREITERKKAEEKIQTLANAVESSNDAIVTQSLDGIVTSWNKGAEQIYGFSKEEMLGKPISIIEPDNLKGETKQLLEKIKQGKNIQHYETLRLRGSIEMLGYCQEQLNGRLWCDFFDEEGKAVAKLNMKKRRQGINEIHRI